MYNRSLKNSEHFSLRLTAYCNLKQYLCFRLPAKIDFAWDQNLTFINDFSIICSFIVKNMRSSTTKFWINFSVFSTRKSLVFWVAGEVGVLVQSIVYPTRRLLYLRDETALPVAVQNSKRKAALALLISHCVFDKRKNHNSWSTKCRQSRFAAFELPKRKVQRQQNSSSVAVWSATRIIRNLLKACTCAYLSTADRPLCSHERALEPRDPKLFALNLPDSVSFRALLQAFCATRRAWSCSQQFSRAI